MKTLCTILAAAGIFGLLAVEGPTFASTLIVKAVSTLFLLPAGIPVIREELNKGRA